MFVQVREKQKRKFERMKKTEPRDDMNKRRVMHLSSRNLSEPDVLRKGLNFVPTPTNIPVAEREEL